MKVQITVLVFTGESLNSSLKKPISDLWGMSWALIYSSGSQRANETLSLFIHIPKGLATMKNGSNSLRGRLPAQFAIKSWILVSAAGTDMVSKAAPASESLLCQGGVGGNGEGGKGKERWGGRRHCVAGGQELSSRGDTRRRLLCELSSKMCHSPFSIQIMLICQPRSVNTVFPCAFCK